LTLGILEEKGIDFQVIKYLDDTPSAEELKALLSQLKLAPCLKEIPAFVDFYDKHSDKVELLGMDYEQVNIDKITDFTDSFMVNYPIILSSDKNRAEFEKFGKVVGMPTTYIYAPDGALINHYIGEINIKTLEEAIR
jgi:arsenate reductase-like glutaredoxin family protein